SGVLERFCQGREPFLPRREVLIRTELDEARTGIALRPGTGSAEFDLDRIRHHGAIGEQPISPAFVDEVEEDEIELLREPDHTDDPVALEIAGDHADLER